MDYVINKMKRPYRCYKCKQEIKPTKNTPGYGIYKKHKYCYLCCAELDKQRMHETGKIVLYLVKKNDKFIVTNWAGTLIFKVNTWSRSKGCHNIARIRYDVWFNDHYNDKWHGVSYGENTQILYCKRAKITKI